jgi:glutamate dehydrogenase
MNPITHHSPAASTTTVDDLCTHITETYPGESSLLCDFARLFFTKSPRSLLAERDVETLTSLTRGAFRFLQSSRGDEPSVQVVNPEDEGWKAPVTVIRARLGDRPFIVDTIREYLSAENIQIHHYIYPVLRVVRDAAGEVVGLEEPTEPPLVAVVHCEVSRIASAERRAELEAEICRRLNDVVAATNDFGAMLEQLERVAQEVQDYAERLPERAPEFEEIGDFLRWLRLENFVFLGYRAYRLEHEGDATALHVEPDTGIGILGRQKDSKYAGGVPLSELPDALRRRVVAGPTLIISKTNRESTVHRRARMDYIGIKRLDERGRVVGEHRFLGLFTSKAYAEHAEVIPILRQKLERVLQSSGAAPGSHDYKEIITIFNAMPKEEVFQASAAELEREIQTVLSWLFVDEVHVTLRPDPLGRGASVMVILPRGKFSGEVRQRIEEALLRRLDGSILNYHLALSAGDQARLHFYVSASAEAVQSCNPRELEYEITQIIRSWEDRLTEELEREFDPAEAHRLVRVYAPAFNDEYRAATLPAVAIQDIRQLEALLTENRGVRLDLRSPRGRGRAEDFAGVSILKLFLRDERLVLSDFMPMLEYAGVRVLEMTPFAVTGPGLPNFMIYSFAVQGPEGQPLPTDRTAALAEMLLDVREGIARNDAFNSICISAGLRWRELEVLRTYAHYGFQVGMLPTRFAVARALTRYPEIARLLMAYFRAKFDPELGDGEATSAERGARADRQAAGTGEGSGTPLDATSEIRDRDEAIRQAYEAVTNALDSVSALADDRALRRMLALMSATMRTNYYRHGGADPTFTSGGAPYVSIKIGCADVDELQKSRLLYEIYVHSANMEGIHLRGASVSRGGIRWSDRPDDFRTEILGLVTTQMVKNAVIVPGGSKGGFITRRSFADRDAMMAEAADQYRTLIRGMLDITDNIVDGRVVPPTGVVRHDGDDPYLVVAADKGTAHLSDSANAVSTEYGFWLDDAFASGGSYGYDHKKEGITARGAWECVRRHFREMGKDIQTEPFTVVGIGDMSGDVFGNGMLLSRQIRLLAAFDHRHIFIDPDPDPETSYLERERMFRLPRSSWEDYDRSLLSPGGMIVPRGSKEVTLTPEARRALGLSEQVTRLDGEALIRAVLKAPAELLWNGGIGTYVKDPDETHADAGDSTNDPVRVNADELRCLVVGEGGNLGLTQRARISFALRGGRINTDALDNSAGVDMSDHEVNLKILLGSAVAAGELSIERRNELLERMANEVNRLVLKNNINQSLAISLDQTRSREALRDFAALISSFERERILDRGSEDLPTTETIQEREAMGIGLTRPTLCVLLAFAKLYTKGRLLASELPDDPALFPYLHGYFPAEGVEAAGEDRMAKHRLRREIITTELVNDLVDLMGSSFLHRVARDSGQEIPAAVRAWLIASQVSGAPEVRADLARLEGEVPAQVIYRWLFGLARVLERTTLWALANVTPEASTTAVIEDLRSGLARLRAEFAQIVTGEDRELFINRVQELSELGVDDALGQRIITLRFLPQMLNIMRIAQEAGQDPVDTASAYYRVSTDFGCAALRQALAATASDEPWEQRYVQLLVEDVDRAHRALTRKALAGRAEGIPLEKALARVEAARGAQIEAYRSLMQELAGFETAPLAGYALAARALGEVAGSA